MKIRHISLCIATLITSGASSLSTAALPNHFINGETTNADTINENFTYLENKLSQIESRIEHGDLPPTNYNPDSASQYRREAQGRSAGQTENIRGVDYVFVAFPVYDLSATKSYRLTFPVAKCATMDGLGTTQSCNGGTPNTYVQTFHAEEAFTEQFKIDGHPARANISEVRDIKHYYDRVERSWQFRIVDTLTLESVEIIVGGSRVVVKMDTHTKSTSTPVSANSEPGETDFATGANWAALGASTLSTDPLFQLLDRISITPNGAQP